jgi:hypothetical protein
MRRAALLLALVLLAVAPPAGVIGASWVTSTGSGAAAGRFAKGVDVEPSSTELPGPAPLTL